MRGIIQRIVNAINKAFKRWENRYYGKSWANELAEMKEENKVVQAWYSLLNETIQKQEAGPQVRGTVQAQGRRAQTEGVQERQENKEQETAEKPKEAEHKASLDMDALRKAGINPDAYYDYSKSFAEQVDDWVAGKMPKKDTLIIGATPVVYQEIGLSALPLTVNQAHMEHWLSHTYRPNHNMTVDEVKKLPSKIKKPIAIIPSKSKGVSHYSVIAYIEMTLDGEQIVVPVQIGQSGVENNIDIDVNMAASAYGRDTAIKEIVEAISKELTPGNEVGIYYVNKKATSRLLQTKGLELPSSLQTTDGFMHKITDEGSPVKVLPKNPLSTMQFNRWFGKSKAVNTDGSPMVLYHHTNEIFTEFDLSRSGSNQGSSLGDGIYLSSSPTAFSSEEYGKTRMKLYASIQKPYDATRGLTKKQAQYVVEKYGALKHDIKAHGGLYAEHAINKLMSPLRALDYIKEYAGDAGIRTGDIFEELGYDGIKNGNEWVVFKPSQVKSATDNIGLFDKYNNDTRYSLDTDAMRSGIREAFTQINGDKLHEAIDLMDNVQSVRAWAFKDVSRMMDALAGSNKDLRNTLHTLFEEPHSRATGNYANGIANLNRQLLDIGKRAGVFDEKGKNFDEKKSAFLGKRNTKSEPAARRQRV